MKVGLSLLVRAPLVARFAGRIRIRSRWGFANVLCFDSLPFPGGSVTHAEEAYRFDFGLFFEIIRLGEQ